ncbi:zinc-binding dehydrogenase [Streptomyces sp. NPDC002143]
MCAVRSPGGAVGENAPATSGTAAPAPCSRYAARRRGISSSSASCAPCAGSRATTERTRQTALRQGAIPIATTNSPAKEQRLRDAGAAHVMVPGRDDLTRAILEATGGKGAQAVFDAVAGPAIEDLARATVRDGVILVHGSLSGRPTPMPGLSQMRPVYVRPYTLSRPISTWKRGPRSATSSSPSPRSRTRPDRSSIGGIPWAKPPQWCRQTNDDRCPTRPMNPDIPGPDGDADPIRSDGAVLISLPDECRRMSSAARPTAEVSQGREGSVPCAP